MMAALIARTITSRQNEWFKRFRAAAHHHDEEVIVEGKKQVADLVAAGITPIAVAMSSEESLDLPHGTQTFLFTSELVAAMGATESSQGVVALIRRPAHALRSLPAITRALVVLDGVQDPGNVGTIIRLAVAFEAEGVILTPGCADPWSPKVIRSSAGAHFATSLFEATPAEILSFAAERGLPLYATAMDGADYRSIDQPSVIVFGSEGRGVSDELLAQARRLTILTSERVESLNVATAAAIILAKLYER